MKINRSSMFSSLWFLVLVFLSLAATTPSSFPLMGIASPSLLLSVSAASARSGGTTATCDDSSTEDDGSSSCGNPDADAIELDADVDVITLVEDDSIPSLNGYGKDEQTKTKDFAEYFSAYAELHHQKDMLTDTHRMDSYYRAIMDNAETCFKNKVVLDVGTGSGILAIWAAKAGAKKVYAIEYTDMAHNARQLIKDNGVDHIVTVIQGTVESITLPLMEDGLLLADGDSDEHVVDVIVSEWMGYMLLRESMLDSVLVARDRYLKPGTGLMFPSHATIYLAPIKDEQSRLDNVRDYDDAVQDWYAFLEATSDKYKVNYETLSDNFIQEQHDFYLGTSQWKELSDQNFVLSTSNSDLFDADVPEVSDDTNAQQQQPYTVIKELDLSTCTLEDTRGIFGRTTDPEQIQQGNYDWNEFDFVIDPLKVTSAISGFASWFTTDFKSRTDAMGIQNKAPQLKDNYVTLDTGPSQGYTHWGQQAFYFQDAIRIKTDLKQASGGKNSPKGRDQDSVRVHLKGKIELMRTKENKRLYNVRIEHHLEEIIHSNPTSTTSSDNDIITRQTDVIEAVYKMI
eukprot:CAMPEP_0170830886 /NCGR_PEP_ID=MMETSP0733-20121128/49634_1 /TAXON_ID=186038 /ORGANISM="Fragilariopsis kerguelensis, Strain L26-C5" /LENGTH=568 /DNA_ID=CAMNT_0011196347 /DNA_START=80 /DNA_END=1786 /DNA_ORIENTATION=+